MVEAEFSFNYNPGYAVTNQIYYALCSSKPIKGASRTHLMSYQSRLKFNNSGIDQNMFTNIIVSTILSI